MKNLAVYYFVILAPLVAILFTLKERNGTFAILLLIYALVYRPLTDGYRLYVKGLITRKEIGNMFIPFYYRAKWFKELYIS
jgi:hypothetical protein